MIDHPVLPVALVFGNAEACAHLRAALDSIGARIVCDSPVQSLDAARINDSGAGVVLVNLDDGVGERLDEVYDSLDESRYRVVFNDPDTSLDLTGWEHARWLRHLAAKLRDDGDIDPPRPEDAAVAVSDAGGVDAVTEDWMNEALDVLGEVPADTRPEPDVARAFDDNGVDLDFDAIALDLSTPEGEDTLPAESGIELSFEALTDEGSSDAATIAVDLDLPEGLEIDPASPSAEDPLEFDTADAPVIDLDSVVVFDEVEAWRDTEQPAPGVDAMAADAPESMPAEPSSLEGDDLSFDALEAEFNAAFGDDALAALDAAAATPAVDAPQEPVLHDDFAAAPPNDAHGAAPASEATDDPTESRHDFEFALDDELAPSVPVPAPVPAPSFDLDHLSLVELEPDLPPQREWTAVEHRLDPDAKPDEPPVKSVPVTPAAAPASRDPAAGGEFGIELMTAADYLAPDAPDDDQDRPVQVPELMSLSDAVAPEVEGKASRADAVKVASRPIQRVIILAASIGGPDAVREFLSVLPERFPATFVLVQHLGSEFIDLMISQLAKSSALPVRLPRSGERAVSGEVLVVPSGRRLRLPRSGEVEIGSAAEGAAKEPAINDTLTMAAENFGTEAMAIIFSGMSSDAVAGALELASRGGSVWVQEPASCVVSTMVDGVIAAGVARFVGTPRALGEHLIEHIAGTAGQTT